MTGVPSHKRRLAETRYINDRLNSGWFFVVVPTGKRLDKTGEVLHALDTGKSLRQERQERPA